MLCSNLYHHHHHLCVLPYLKIHVFGPYKNRNCQDLIRFQLSLLSCLLIQTLKAVLLLYSNLSLHLPNGLLVDSFSTEIMYVFMSPQNPRPLSRSDTSDTIRDYNSERHEKLGDSILLCALAKYTVHGNRPWAGFF